MVRMSLLWDDSWPLLAARGRFPCDADQPAIGLSENWRRFAGGAKVDFLSGGQRAVGSWRPGGKLAPQHADAAAGKGFPGLCCAQNAKIAKTLAPMRQFLIART